MKRFKAAADNAEKVEEELKGEKRKYQKEVSMPILVLFTDLVPNL